MMEIDAMKINMNDTPEEMELTYNDLLAKWESIPEAYRGHPYQLYEKLLNLFPTVCADDKKALQTNNNTFQTMGMTMPTYSQIGQRIVTSVIKYRHSNPNTLWAAGGGGERPPAGREQGDRRREGKCSNCLGNHNPWECPKKCAGCGTAYCGSRAKASDCNCKKAKLPLREEITNMKGHVGSTRNSTRSWRRCTPSSTVGGGGS